MKTAFSMAFRSFLVMVSNADKNCIHGKLGKHRSLTDSTILIQENWHSYNLKTAFSMAFVSYEKQPFQCCHIILNKISNADKKLHPWKTWKTQISNGFNNPYTRELESIGSKQTIIHSKPIKSI